MLTELKRDEYHPAYLYHKAPFADPKDLPDELKPYASRPAEAQGGQAHPARPGRLADRRQVPVRHPDGRGVRPVRQVGQGTQGGDDPARSRASSPASRPRSPTPTRSRCRSRTGTTSRSRSPPTAKRLVTRQTEFDIFLRDTDGVTSKRAVQIVVEEDRPPEVDVVVDVIRKVGGTYLCTPQALIPFTGRARSGTTRGSTGSSTCSRYSEVEPMAVTLKRLEYAAWSFNAAPVLPYDRGPDLPGGDADRELPPRSPGPGHGGRPACRSRSSSTSTRAGRSPWSELKKHLDGPRPLGPDVTVVNLVDTWVEAAGRQNPGEDRFRVRPEEGGRRASSGPARRRPSGPTS